MKKLVGASIFLSGFAILYAVVGTIEVGAMIDGITIATTIIGGCAMILGAFLSMDWRDE